MDTNPRQIFLNSDHADKYFIINETGGTDSSTCLFNFTEPIIAPPGYDISLGVISFMIPCSWNRINVYNNTLVLKTTAQPSGVSISIPIGSYNITTLKNTLNSLLSSHGIVVTYVTETNRYTFTAGSGTFTFDSASTCLRLLGFTVNESHTSTGLVLKSNSVIDLSGIANLYISTSLQTHNYDSRIKKMSNILAIVPVNQQSNGILQYTDHQPIRNIVNPTTISQIHVFITDENGNLINLRNARWSGIMLVNFVPKVLVTIENKIVDQSITE